MDAGCQGKQGQAQDDISKADNHSCTLKSKLYQSYTSINVALHVAVSVMASLGQSLKKVLGSFSVGAKSLNLLNVRNHDCDLLNVY